MILVYDNFKWIFCLILIYDYLKSGFSFILIYDDFSEFSVQRSYVFTKRNQSYLLGGLRLI